MERFKKNTILAAQNLSVGYPLKKDFKVVVSDINLEIDGTW
jgi:ABC-type microcin C transport system duplicated ATPase subunit YejF